MVRISLSHLAFDPTHLPESNVPLNGLFLLPSPGRVTPVKGRDFCLDCVAVPETIPWMSSANGSLLFWCAGTRPLA